MRRILITGCSSGIGRDAAIHLASLGHHVIATARRPESLKDLDVAQRLALDITIPAQVRAVSAAAGPVDVLVNNAGLGMWGPVEHASAEHIERVLATNLVGAVSMSQAVLPSMRAQGRGLIVQISSGAGRRPQPFVGMYGASKAALESVSMALRLELKDSGVNVVILGMGAVASDIDVNRLVNLAQGTDYGPACARMAARIRRLRKGALAPRAVSEALAALIEHPDPPFRSYVDEAYGRALDAAADGTL